MLAINSDHDDDKCNGAAVGTANGDVMTGLFKDQPLERISRFMNPVSRPEKKRDFRFSKVRPPITSSAA